MNDLPTQPDPHPRTPSSADVLSTDGLPVEGRDLEIEATAENDATLDPVSIPLASYREDGFAHFFANEHRTFHPVSSDRASGAPESLLPVGAGHRKLPQQPSAAFHRVLARKEGDPVLTDAEAILGLPVSVSRRQAARTGTAGEGPGQASRPTTSLPLPDELLQGDPGYADHVLARAFEDSSCGSFRKMRQRRAQSPSKENGNAASGTSPHAVPPNNALRRTLPMVRLVDGGIEFSESPTHAETARRSADPNLRLLIESWPMLSRKVRDAVMAIVRLG